jgi:hypothetical protein
MVCFVEITYDLDFAYCIVLGVIFVSDLYQLPLWSLKAKRVTVLIP